MSVKWAIITGASSGIGRALAFEFAGGGFNVVLIARNKTALAEVAAECSRRSGVETEIVTTDLSDTNALDDFISTLSSESRRYEVLVNNAGFGIHGDFASTDIDQNVQLVNVQVASALKLTRAVLPAMIARHSGHILNVASVYSFSPVPFQSVYAACKAFLLSFSSALENELKETGVRVTRPELFKFGIRGASLEFHWVRPPITASARRRRPSGLSARSRTAYSP